MPVRLTADLGADWGRTVWIDNKPTIFLAHDLGDVQMRCTLAHELHHVARGAPCHTRCPNDEFEVRIATARWLLPDTERVARALADHPIREAAAHLGVIRRVLLDRLYSLGTDDVARVGTRLTAPPALLQAAACETPGDPRRTTPSEGYRCLAANDRPGSCSSTHAISAAAPASPARAR